MDISILNTLVGGGIGVLASLLVLIVTRLFQNEKDKRERKQTNEDFRRDETVQYVKDRIQQLETIVLEIAALGSEYFYLFSWEEKNKRTEELLQKVMVINHKKNHMLILSKLLMGIDLPPVIL